MFIAEQQLTSLSPRREILSHNHNLIARDGYAAELSVARSTDASKLARSRCKANLSFSAKKTRRFSRVFCRQKRDSVQSNICIFTMFFSKFSFCKNYWCKNYQSRTCDKKPKQVYFDIETIF